MAQGDGQWAGEREARILAALRAGDGRITGARRAVIATLLHGPHHQTADDIAASVQAQHPDVHLSTVYRTLDTLERLGVVEHVHLGHGRAVYHLHDELHHHLVCRRCGGVVEVPDRDFDELRAELLGRYDFAIEPHHFALLGHCAHCREVGADA